MRFALWMIAGSLLIAGCSKKATDANTASSSGKTVASSSPTDSSSSSSTDASPSKDSSGPTLIVPDQAEAAKIQITPANAKVQFVGTHVGPKPDPNARLGMFKEFTGEAVLSSDRQSLESVSLEIQAGSLETQNGKLTNHLNDEEFLDTRSHPAITFKSRSISQGEQGKTNITGDLTLHGVTKQITIPADVTINDQGISLNAEFRIDRTEFGMDQLLNRVNKEVDITVIVGQMANAAE